MRQFLLQMAGGSGAGKSTLSRALATKTGAIVLDNDVLKSTALDNGIGWDMAGRMAYTGIRAIAESLLEQGQSVILDSPCRFQQIVDEGTRIAEKYGVHYVYIECVVDDEQILRERMATRPRLRSQRPAFDRLPPDAPHARIKQSDVPVIPASIYPQSAWIQIDTRQPLAVCVQVAMTYLQEITRAP